MKVPEFLFAVVNPTITLLLKSPLHSLASKSLMLITFTGRKSGRQFTTPVRYTREGTTVRAYSSAETQWWRNLRGGADVTLLVNGTTARYRAALIENDPPAVRAHLERYLAEYPQDAAYHEIKLEAGKRLNPDDLARAAQTAVVVEATPV